MSRIRKFGTSSMVSRRSDGKLVAAVCINTRGPDIVGRCGRGIATTPTLAVARALSDLSYQLRVGKKRAGQAGKPSMGSRRR